MCAHCAEQLVEEIGPALDSRGITDVDERCLAAASIAWGLGVAIGVAVADERDARLAT